METRHAREGLVDIGSVIEAWNKVTGQNIESGDIKSNQYLSTTLWGKNGVSATIELHPDSLNGRHRLAIEDFSESEEVDKGNYLDCINMVSQTANSLRAAGLNFDVSGLEGYQPDGPKILADIRALLVEDKDVSNVHQLHREQVA